jgi:large subunit ribosomal protein L30
MGLRRINQTVIRQDTPAMRGMIRQISHLVEVQE